MTTNLDLLNLASDASLSLAVHGDLTHLDAVTGERLSGLAGDRGRPVIFLVIRGDLSVQKDMDTYDGMLSVLQSRRESFSDLEVLLVTCFGAEIVSTLIETRYELLTVLESRFGAPTSFQELGTFAISEHQLSESE